jgi:cyclophilin family peptidyl-prolyl cis-trans isomerase
MTANPPQQLEGTESPSQVELLWDRYQKPFNLVLTLALLAIAGFYGLKFYRQQETNKSWTTFATSIGLDKVYTDTEGRMSGLAEHLSRQQLATLEGYLAKADQSQRPFVLLAIARRAMGEKNWDRAEAALAELESKHASHSLVVATDYPIQIRDRVKQEKDEASAPTPDKKPELKPARAGSAVQMLREQITAAKNFTVPAQFQKPEIPASAPKVKFEFSDGSSITIALMAEQAPQHAERFLALAKQEGGAFWVGLSVDEVQRNGKGFSQRPKQFHLGFETTKEAEISKWTKTDPSKNEIEFGPSKLSHFAGAVAAREGADGKSAVDRFWVCAEDAAQFDGQRAVFGYVVEGLENVAKICEAPMSVQEDEAGSGVPSDKITVTAVTVL